VSLHGVLFPADNSAPITSFCNNVRAAGSYDKFVHRASKCDAVTTARWDGRTDRRKWRRRIEYCASIDADTAELRHDDNGI